MKLVFVFTFILFFAPGCPIKIRITSSTDPQLISGRTVFKCATEEMLPNVVYQWYNKSALMQSGSQYALQQTGDFSYTCVASYTTSRLSCGDNQTVSGTASGWQTLSCYDTCEQV
jgi:hypothetical protein